MIIETKFNKGDIVYVLDALASYRETCILCKASGKVEIKHDVEKIIITCPGCYGDGTNWVYINNSDYSFDVEQGEIINIIIDIEEDSQIYYNIKIENDTGNHVNLSEQESYLESGVFKSETDAVFALNREDENNYYLKEILNSY